MTHDIVQRCQLALEEADTSGDLSYQEIARIVLTASGITELTEALDRARHDISFLLSCLDMCDEAEAPPCELDALDLAILGDIRRDNPLLTKIGGEA
jgi:hypothetical protein